MTIDKDMYQKALESYHITEDNLYAGFTDMGQSSEHLGFQITSGFALSDEGPDGFIRIAQKLRHCFLGAASLKTMRENYKNIQKSTIEYIDSDRLGGLWKAKTFFVLMVPKDLKSQCPVYVTCLRAFTSERVIDWASKNHPDYIAAITGTEEDFLETMQAMENILKTQDFSRIEGDFREVFCGVKPQYLLNTKKRPHAIDTHLFAINNMEEA